MPATIFGPEIIIADQDGTNQVTLQDVSGPYPVPQPQAEYQVELLKMRQGEDGPGYRVAQLGGASEDEQDIEFAVKFLSPSQFQALWAKYYRQPAEPIVYSMDGGITWCLATFQRNGFTPANWEQDWETQSAVIRLHKLGIITIE